MDLSIPIDTTSKIILIRVYDSSSTIGALLAGLVYNTASLTAYYNREGAAGAATAISLVTATKGTWTSSGFVAVDGTNMPGWYELHIPNAALASGAKSVAIHLKGAANMVPVPILIELTATSNQDAVRGGMTALPNAAPGAAGGVFIAGTNAATTITTALTTTFTGNLTGTTAKSPATLAAADVSGNLPVDLQTIKTQAITCAAGVTVSPFVGNATAAINVDASGYIRLQAVQTGTTIPTVTTVTNQLTAAAIATGVWQDATEGDFTVTSSIGKNLKIADTTPGAAGGHFIAGTNAATSITTALTANITGNLSGSVGSVSGSVTGSVGSVSGITFPTNFGVLSISATTGLVDITQTAADKVWGTTARVLTAGTNIALAKGTGVTGFNDLDATGVAAATWNAAVVTYGSAGSYGLLIETNLDAAVSTRSTYAGGAVASVTGAVGSITGVTFPTNFEHLAITDTTGIVTAAVSSIANDAITAASVKADAVTKIQSGLATPTNITAATGVVLARPTGAVVADAGNSAMSFKTNLASAEDDYIKDAYIKFTAGANINQVKRVSAYNGTTKFVTMIAAFTDIPDTADAFIIINE